MAAVLPATANITINTANSVSFNFTSTAANATITAQAGAITINQSASGATARFIVNGTGAMDISQLVTAGIAAGWIEGTGNLFIGSKNLAVGNNLSTTFSGTIQDGGVNGGTGGSLTKAGIGTLTLSGSQHLYRRDHRQRRHAGRSNGSIAVSR